MVIHFFKSRSKERINFFELIDEYFDKKSNCKIYSDEQEMKIVMDMPEFDFSYYYLITKRSRVASIYKLNSDYVNINLLCEIPLGIPQFLIRYILKQIDEICQQFELVIYYNQLDNIREFKIFEMIQSLLKERETYLIDNPSIKRYPVSEYKLNQICLYQMLIPKIPDLVKTDVVVNPYIVLINRNDYQVELSINWRIDQPMVFPPHLSYVHIEEEENLISIIPFDIFMKVAERNMFEIKDSASDIKLMFLNEKGCAKVKKGIRKMRKSVINSSNFDIIKLIDLIEE